jgi:hypothetical protein
MGFFEKIKNSVESSEVKSKKSHLKNLYQIAMADGNLDNREFDFLLNVANKLYLNPSVVQNVIQFPEDIFFYIPLNNNEKIDQIYDCVMMALVDGNLNENEIATCKLISVKFGFRPIIVDKIINEIIKGIADNIASDILLRKLLNEI